MMIHRWDLLWEWSFSKGVTSSSLHNGSKMTITQLDTSCKQKKNTSSRNGLPLSELSASRTQYAPKNYKILQYAFFLFNVWLSDPIVENNTYLKQRLWWDKAGIRKILIELILLWNFISTTMSSLTRCTHWCNSSSMNVLGVINAFMIECMLSPLYETKPITSIVRKAKNLWLDKS